MSKPTSPAYKTKNWPAYNEALKRRGSLTIWFDPAMTWEAALTGKRGRQPDYSDAAIQTCLTLKVLFGMALSRHVRHIDARSLAGSLVSRAQGVLGWRGLTLDLKDCEFQALVEGLALAEQHLRPFAWPVASQRQGRVRVHDGVLGGVTISGVPEVWRPLLAFVAYAGLGLHTTRGMGRAIVLPEPPTLRGAGAGGGR